MRPIILTITGLILSLSVIMTSAQCDAFVQDALTIVGDSCEALDRNTACYGYTEVQASFVDTQPLNTFSQPADRVGIDLVSSIRTGGYAPERDAWGVAVLSLQANLPGTLPGQAVTMLLVGGGELYDSTPTDSDPMTAFTFTSGIGMAACQQAPSALAIRSPQGSTVALNINGADVTIGSTVIFTENPETNTLTAFVTEGQMTMTEGGTVVPAGNALEMDVSPDARQITRWGQPRLMNPAETELGGLMDTMYNEMGVTNDTTVGDDGTPTTVIVQPGDNLFRIALENETCVSALVNANSLSESQIRALPVGLELTLTDDSTCGAFVNDITVPPPVITNPPDEETPAFICNTLRPTSPTDGLPVDNVTFYWDGVPDAVAYAVTLSKDGVPVLSGTVNAPQTSYSAKLSNIPTGLGTYQWTVTAIGPEDTTCSATSPTMQRQWLEDTDDRSDDEDVEEDKDPFCDPFYAALGYC